MIERLGPEQFSQRWAGHSFDDKCPSRPYKYNSVNRSAREYRRGMFKAVKMAGDASYSWGNRERAKAYTALEKFFQTSSAEHWPIQVFGEGEVFGLGNFPKGTIVRYEIDIIDRNSEFINKSGFGIIGQAKTNVGGYLDVLIEAPDELVPSQLKGLDNVSPNEYRRGAVVGEVVHEKYPGPYSSYDNMFRYSLIEVWQLGQAVREQVKIPGFKPKKAK